MWMFCNVLCMHYSELKIVCTRTPNDTSHDANAVYSFALSAINGVWCAQDASSRIAADAALILTFFACACDCELAYGAIYMCVVLTYVVHTHRWNDVGDQLREYRCVGELVTSVAPLLHAAAVGGNRWLHAHAMARKAAVVCAACAHVRACQRVRIHRVNEDRYNPVKEIKLSS